MNKVDKLVRDLQEIMDEIQYYWGRSEVIYNKTKALQAEYDEVLTELEKLKEEDDES